MRKEKLQNAVWQFTNPGNLPGGKRRLQRFLSLLLAVVLCFTTVASMPGLAIKAKAEGEVYSLTPSSPGNYKFSYATDSMAYSNGATVYLQAWNHGTETLHLGVENENYCKLEFTENAYRVQSFETKDVGVTQYYYGWALQRIATLQLKNDLDKGVYEDTLTIKYDPTGQKNYTVELCTWTVKVSIVDSVTTLTLAGVTAPVDGASPQTAGIAITEEGITAGEAYWTKADGTQMEAGEQFEAGESYVLCVPYTEEALYKLVDYQAKDNIAVNTEAPDEKELDTSSGQIKLTYHVPGTEKSISFDGNGGYGSMDTVQTEKNSYVLPESIFGTPAADKAFDHWEVEGEAYNPGDTLRLTGDATVKAVWQDAQYNMYFRMPTCSYGTKSVGYTGDGQEWAYVINRSTVPILTGSDTYKAEWEKGEAFTFSTEYSSIPVSVDYGSPLGWSYTGLGVIRHKPGLSKGVYEDTLTISYDPTKQGNFVELCKLSVSMTVAEPVTDFHITGITRPVAGALPTTEGIAFTDETVTGVDSAQWMISNNGLDYMKTGETFVAGKTYYLCITPQFAEGYAIDDSTVNVTANEEPEEANRQGGGMKLKYSIPGEEKTISFAAGGGSGTMESVSVQKGAQYTLPECTFTAPEGSEFEGWKNSIGNIFQPGSQFTVQGTQTFTASWSKLSFNVNASASAAEGGSVTGDGAYEYGATATLKAVPADGYVFEGWYENNSAVSKEAEYSFTVSKGRDLTAVFKQKFAVTFETNGGSTVATQNIVDGSQAVKPSDPTKAGFTFDGWCADAELTTAFDFDAAITTATTIYAKWKANTLTGTVTITGEAVYGQTLKAEFTGSAVGTLSYQWKRGENEITDATSSTYELVQADIGQTISCDVTSSIETGTVTGTSAKVEKAAGPGAPTEPTGTATSVEGASDGKITGVDSTMQYASNTDFTDAKDISGTTVTGLKAGTYYVRVKETATNKAGAYAVVTVADGPNAFSGTVTITGNLKYNETLTAVVTGANDGETLSYQWMRGENKVNGATASTYKTVQADIGQPLRCIVTSGSRVGSIEGVAGAIIDKADSPEAPANITSIAVTVKGEADGKINGTTTAMEYATTADFSDAKAVEGTEIIGLTAGTYYVRVAETETTKAGKAQTIVVEDGPAILTGTVTISGSAKYNETLTATVTDTNSSGTLKYQWKRGGEAIDGETSSTYKLTQADIGQTISCEVTSTKELKSITGTMSGKVEKADNPVVPSGLIGTAATQKGASDGKIIGTTTAMEYATKADFTDAKVVTGTEITDLKAGTYYVRLKETETTKAGEAQKVTVEDGPAILTGTVTITGTLKSGETLTATVTGTNNSGILKYQWKRDGVAIGGGTDAEYKLGQLDIGKTISCEVTSTVELGSITGTTGTKVEEATETENDSPIVDTSDEEDDDAYVPTTDRGNQSSNLPIINRTGTRMVVISGMGAAKTAAGITNDDYLEVEMISLSADTLAAQMIRQFAADRNLSIADYFDVNVYRVTANGVRVGRVTEFAAPIDLMFEAPEGVDPAQYDISVLRLHNGIINQLKDKDNDPITVTVATDRCSAYVLVYGAKDGTAAGTNGKKTINSTASGTGKNASPKTYDASKYVPAAAETEIAEFVQKQSVEEALEELPGKLPEQAAADLLITPQAAPFPMGIVIALLLFMVAFIGGEYVYFKRKERK